MSPRLSPRAARAIGATGRVLIGAGALVLLFAAYQLWGTGYAHSRAQERLDDEFADRLAAVDPSDPDDADGTTTTTADGPTTTTTVDPEVLALLVPAHGDPVARLRMPTIGVDEVVVHGVEVADLRQGPGHYPETPLPGQSGNAAIAGHRTTYGQPFHDLDLLQPGDEIHVETLQGTFTYVVDGHPADDGDERGHVIVADDAVEVLDDVGVDRLTLTACHPKFSSRQRIVVTATLDGDPVDAPPVPDDPDEPEDGLEDPDDGAAAEPADDFGEGLGGDPSALVPAVGWSAAFLVVLAGVIVLGRRWRRSPAYLLGAPVMAVPLVIAFSHLDRYLPAY